MEQRAGPHTWRGRFWVPRSMRLRGFHERRLTVGCGLDFCALRPPYRHRPAASGPQWAGALAAAWYVRKRIKAETLCGPPSTKAKATHPAARTARHGANTQAPGTRHPGLDRPHVKTCKTTGPWSRTHTKIRITETDPQPPSVTSGAWMHGQAGLPVAADKTMQTDPGNLQV